MRERRQLRMSPSWLNLKKKKKKKKLVKAYAFILWERLKAGGEGGDRG